MRPLARVPSLKLKLGGLIVLAVAVTALMSLIGLRLGLPIWVRPLIASAIALGIVQVVARGMTAPLRAMVAAAERMRQGDYDQRIDTDSVDEVGQLAAAFNEMASSLALLDRLRRDLVANAAHELRTPIAGLQASLENMVDGITPADTAHLSAMHGQVTRLGDLVGQLLDLSRLESGTAHLSTSPTDLAALVVAGVADLSAIAGQRGITVDIDTPPGPVTLTGDPTRLRQVVVNLLGNALAHLPDGGAVHLSVAATPTHVRLTVHDDGPGIPAADAEHVFERFYRADGSRGSRGGSGLGLAICRWIVDLHGGRIHLDTSAPGCRMVVELPRKHAHPKPAHSPPQVKE